MAIDKDLKLSHVVAAAIRQAGRNPPTANDIAEGVEVFARQVKSDLRMSAGTHRLLQKIGYSVVTAGRTEYDNPVDTSRVRYIYLLDAQDKGRGTAQAGTTTSLTLAADHDRQPLELLGKKIVLTGGTYGTPDENGLHIAGSIGAYDNTTKVATLTNGWAAFPASDTEYLIGDYSCLLYERDLGDPSGSGGPDFGYQDRPLAFSQSGQGIILNCVPDKTYALRWHYFIDLDRVDEESDLFKVLLREWFSVWVQGIKTYAMARFDDDRYTQAILVYNTMLQTLEAQSAAFGVVQPRETY